jgi:FdrA protein
MTTLSKIFPNTYRDSFLLMKVATLIRQLDGIRNAEVMQATPANKQLLERNQLLTEEMRSAGPNDLCISVLADDEQRAISALAQAEAMVNQGGVAQDTSCTAKSLNGALAMLPEANLVFLSIPGAFVKREAMQALRKGLNLFIFSDNVPIADEVEIKTLAAQKDLLVMGPDCGTAIIRGKALGFANAVRRGSVGLIGASGTGLQEVSVLLHHLGGGVSHAIGTGSNDVSDAVGGITMLRGIDLLEQDPATDLIVVVSKPLGPRTRQKVVTRLHACKKPVIVNFLGEQRESSRGNKIAYTATLEDAAFTAAHLSGAGSHKEGLNVLGALGGPNPEECAPVSSQKYLRGCFGGGTLAAESCHILRSRISLVHSNLHLPGLLALDDAHHSSGHCVIDLGADEFTLGKPHPMLDPTIRNERLLQEAHDPETAVLLMDVVLGFGAHPDPVGVSIPYLKEAKRIAQEKGRCLPIVASVCGTEQDPQHLLTQVKQLRNCGVICYVSNSQATAMAASLIPGS